MLRTAAFVAVSALSLVPAVSAQGRRPAPASPAPTPAPLLSRAGLKALKAREIGPAVMGGRVSEIALGADHYPSEPIFVPARGAVEEDEGYVLTQVYDGRRHETYVAVLDAQDFESGPLARVYFGHHIPYSFHGTWVPGK